MTAKILDGKITSQKLLTQMSEKVTNLKEKPTLAVLLAGNNPASQIYVNSKLKKAESLGFKTVFEHKSHDVEEVQILAKIDEWNNNPEINGILVQLPLPKHLDKNKILNAISAKKDVDGLTAINSGMLYTGQKPCVVPCTTRGIFMLLDEYNIEIEGKHVVVIGRSNLVGKPTANEFLKRNATVTICHSHTKNLENIIKTADIVVSAVGEKIINGKILGKNSIVVDVGIFRDANGKITGDADFVSAIDVASFISPVPGGVGLMTVTALMYNLFDLYLMQKS